MPFYPKGNLGNTGSREHGCFLIPNPVIKADLAVLNRLYPLDRPMVTLFHADSAL